MSRVGLRPLPVPKGVSVLVNDNRIHVKGPLGELERSVHPEIKGMVEGGVLTVSRLSDRKFHRALHGLVRSLAANMVEGVSQAFRKVLDFSGVGYRAAMEGENLVVQVGFSHPVKVSPVPSLKFVVESPTRVVVQGYDKEAVGEMAAYIRRIRPAEPYKGKGISYAGEKVRRKAGKAGKVGGKK